MDIKSKLKENSIIFNENEPMSLHTTFKIGGNADIFVVAQNTAQAEKVYRLCKETNTELTLLGNGSNVLVSDDGIRGLVLTLSGIDEITTDGDTITCGAGAAVSSLCKAALENGLSGLEFAYGIPGSVGGIVYMNGGAYGGEIKDVLISATVFDGESIKKIPAEDMKLGYRTSIFKENKNIILAAEFLLKKAEKQEIKSKMDDFIARRKAKQPLEYPSAGSTFKRPEGNFAGALIEKSGLKGYSVGGAAVSEKHAGFLINTGNATAKDVKALIDAVTKKVYEDSKIKLEREVIYLG